jgi:hypothetical protein
MLGNAKESLSILHVIKNSTPLSPKLLETCPLTHQNPPPPRSGQKKWQMENTTTITSRNQSKFCRVDDSGEKIGNLV